MLEHGGNLRQAAVRYGIPLGEWLDLSTGINPQGWPVPPLEAACWQRLPEEGDGLEAAARDYYQCPVTPLPVAGSQAAIQALPRLLPPGVVGMPLPAYGEHRRAWEVAGHQVIPLPHHDPARVAAVLPRLNALVVVNPNNPSGARLPPGQLLAWADALARRGGWLVVDEAFMDPDPADALAPGSGRPGLVVLRSLGKFFGLAGVRLGFVLAPPALADSLAAWLGPWGVSGPARAVGRLALADRAWQAATRQRLRHDGTRLADLLRRAGLPPAGGSALFQWCPTPDARRWQVALARQGVWVRGFDAPPAVRFGLPPAAAWPRLERALARAALERSDAAGG